MYIYVDVRYVYNTEIPTREHRVKNLPTQIKI